VKIRPATPDDIPHMIAIERASETAAHWGEEQYRALFTADVVSRMVLVADISEQDVISRSSCNRLCGFIVTRTVGREWEVENVVVQREIRRSGIGTQLLETILDLGRAGDCGRVFLEVRESNEPARKLYEKSGFREIGTRRSYYENPKENAIVLQLEISNGALENA